MKNIKAIKLNTRLKIDQESSDGGCGWVIYPTAKEPMLIVFSWGAGWDHVSVSYNYRCPTWAEMCFVKDMFFNDDECVIQYHPPKKDYVNRHPYCLHLWKRQGQELELPPKILVG